MFPIDFNRVYTFCLRGQGTGEVGGAPGKNDVPPVRLPLETQYPSFVICYKPRMGERHVAFEEVASKHVSVHPRFNLDFNAPRSEAAAPIL